MFKIHRQKTNFQIPRIKCSKNVNFEFPAIQISSFEFFGTEPSFRANLLPGEPPIRGLLYQFGNRMSSRHARIPRTCPNTQRMCFASNTRNMYFSSRTPARLCAVPHSRGMARLTSRPWVLENQEHGPGVGSKEHGPDVRACPVPVPINI